jgi:two-component system sensor histidine kinase KdpD
MFQITSASAQRLVRAASIGVPSGVWAYAVALIASSSALIVAWWLLAPIETDSSVPALMFLAAVGISGWYGGLGPALVATALGGLAIDYFFEVPRYEIQVTNGQTLTDLLSFLLVAVLLGSLNARLRLSNTRLRAERDRAQAAVEARDDLMATVSHELRTPLTAIMTSVYSLRHEMAALPADKRDGLLGTIEVEAERLAHFVAEALALRRLENGLIPQWQPTSAAEVASAALDRCLPLLGSRPIHFAVDDGLPTVRIDPAMLDQVLTVLVENVAVHTPPETPLTVAGTVSGRDLRLEVSDAGPGIPSSARQLIFDKYERLVPTSPGAGLGLAIARAAVEAQGGRLWVEDSPLGGAQFVLLIPNAVGEGAEA